MPIMHPEKILQRNKSPTDTPADAQVLTFDSASNTWVASNAVALLWSVIETHEAAEAESTHTFNFPPIDFDSVSHLILEVDGGPTATLAMMLKINGDTSYNFDGARIDAGTQTIINVSATGAYQFGSTTLLNTSTNGFTAYIIITLYKGVANNRTTIMSHCVAGADGGGEIIGGIDNTDNDSISAIEVKTSTSTWKVGTRMTLYKVSR